MPALHVDMMSRLSHVFTKKFAEVFFSCGLSNALLHYGGDIHMYLQYDNSLWSILQLTVWASTMPYVIALLCTLLL